MTNSNEQNAEQQKRPDSELTSVAVTLQAITEMDQRHYAPLHTALPDEGAGYEWKHETGDIQSYQHSETAGWLHIDSKANFTTDTLSLSTKKWPSASTRNRLNIVFQAALFQRLHRG